MASRAADTVHRTKVGDITMIILPFRQVMPEVYQQGDA
jgi:hypothetical protein